MPDVRGLKGLRPHKEQITRITCPPYDVIKPGSELDTLLKNLEDSLYHITLGEKPLGALERLLKKGYLLEDGEAAFYVYEQAYAGQVRTGVLTATRVTPYQEGQIIRHEKTFDDKVKGRLELRRKTGYTFEPVFLMTTSRINSLLEKVKNTYPVCYDFVSDFSSLSELHGIRNRIFRFPEESQEGRELRELLAGNPLYIADGHHRYHASLLNGQEYCLAYVCEAEEARIQAYNRVINGMVPFRGIISRLEISPIAEFRTPPKHFFAIYCRQGTFLMKAREVPDDLVLGLDCSILERELYPLLGLTHEMIMDSRYFDYYPESELEKMQALVDEGEYDLAVALHPVSVHELMKVADAGVNNPSVVMPEKSTFFAPKILSGIFVYRHTR